MGFKSTLLTSWHLFYLLHTMKTETIILALAILLTGLMAGIFFTWSNAVKPGIGKLSDIEYRKWGMLSI